MAERRPPKITIQYDDAVTDDELDRILKKTEILDNLLDAQKKASEQKVADAEAKLRAGIETLVNKINAELGKVQ